MIRAGRLLCGALVLSLMAGSAPASPDARGEILSVYREFSDAQNKRDLGRIGTFFVDGPDFLWVSDGQSFWGRDAVLQRMSAFQKAEVWSVSPDLPKARVVTIDPDVAMLHMPLTLSIGRAEAPDKLRFLVSILFRHQQAGWRIAALLTTTEKPAAP